MQKPLSRIFNETAAAAYAAFPQKLARLVVLLVPDTDKPIYVSPQVAQKLTDDTAAIRQAVRKMTDYMHEHHAAGVANKHYSLAGTPVNLIALDSINILGLFSPRYTKEMRAIFNLDHEIGHHILKNGYPFFTGVSAHMAESAADAFAMLRHIQRFGKDTDYMGNRCENIAFTISLMSDTAHYTSDALERAIEVADRMGEDFFKLSLAETASLAAEIADETRIDEETLKKVRDAYRPAAEYCKAHIGSGLQVSTKLYDDDEAAKAVFCRQTLAVMEKHRTDHDIFKAGRRFLSAPQLRGFMQKAAVAEKDGYWARALDFVSTHTPHIPPHQPGARHMPPKI